MNLKRLCRWLTFNTKFNRLQVRYTGFRDRPADERKLRFSNGCREGHTEISFSCCGINLQLVFNPNPMMYHHHHHHHHHLSNFERELDFDKEHGKVSFYLWSIQLRFHMDINQPFIWLTVSIGHENNCQRIYCNFSRIFYWFFCLQLSHFACRNSIDNDVSTDMRRISSTSCSVAWNGNMCNTQRFFICIA